MSSQIRNNVEWDSSTEEEDSCKTNYKTKLRESLRRSQYSAINGSESMVETRKRGRGPSKKPCLNRNALMARENRLRKKAYLEKIENKLSVYQEENKALLNTIKKQGIDIRRLSKEVAYLRSVLNNNTKITALLKTINEGLRKMENQKQNIPHPDNCAQSPKYTDMHRKCVYRVNPKENVRNSQNVNVYANNVNDCSIEHLTHNENFGTVFHNKRYVSDMNSCTKKVQIITNTDHAYSISMISTIDPKNHVRNGEIENTISPNLMSEDLEDSFQDTAKVLDNVMSIGQVNMYNMDDGKNADTIFTDFDQLSSFDMDIFENLPKCDDAINMADAVQDATNLFTEEEMLDSLDNSGICLHIDSDKVSLEFCPVCHSNSKNTGLN